MSVSTPTEALDIQDFQFKLLCRLQVFHAEENLGAPAVNLVATASKYGLIFVGCPSSIQVLQSSSLVKLGSSAVTGEVSEYPRREVPLPSRPSHFAVSCDQSYLVVTLLKDLCVHALVYNVPSFASQNINQVCEVRLSASPDCQVLDAIWNPGVPNVLGTVLSDGSLGVFEFKASGVDINNLPQAAQATCFSWSPKGKQLVVGDSNGALTQYKPDLKAVKVLPAPSLGDNPVAVVNVVWLSNYQFAAVYQDKLNSTEKPCLLIVNAPKAGDVTFVNYEDICYSSGETRSPQFYLIHQPSWNVLLAASANSMELGVLGLASDQVSWMQWVLEDASRAELPLSSATREETYPVGVGLDTSTQHELPWGENQTIPPMPVLHMLSHQGVLCLFYAINLRPDAIRVCTPPDELPDTSGLTLFTTPTAVVLPAPTLALPSPHQEEQLQEGQQTPTQGGWLAQSAADPTISNIRVNLTQKFEELKPSPASASVSTFGAPLGGSRTSFNFGSGAGLMPLAAPPVPTSAVAPQMRTIFDSNPPKPQQSVPLFGGPKASFSSPGTGAGFALTTDNQSPANFSYSLPGTPGTNTPSSLLQKVGSQPEQSTAASEQISRPTPHMESPPIILNIPPVPITAPQLSRPTVMGDNMVGQNTGREESTTDSMVCVAAIRDETFTFHKEMTDLLASVSALDCKIGQEEEMFVLLEKPEMLLEFFRELKETTVAQSSEIHELKTIMVEAFAWLEDARSKLNLLNNPSYIQLTRSQALDPISSKYAEDIRRMRYYIESQLHEINNTLDSKWVRFQDSRKDGAKKKLQVPSLEVVYSTMVMHSNILKKQKQLLEGLLARLPETTRKQIGPVPLVLGVSLSQEKDEKESELSKLAETLVEMKLNPSEGGGNSLKFGQLFVANISRKQLSFMKQAKLRELFDQRKVVHICPTKPASVNFPLVAALSRISSTQDLAAAFPVSSVKPGGITTGQPIVKKNTTPHQAFPIFGGTDANISLQKSLAPKSSTTTIAFSADKDTPIVVTTSKPESVESLFVFGQSKVASQLEGIENKKTSVAEGINFQKFKFPVESNDNEASSFLAKPGSSPSLFGLSKNFTESPSFKQSSSLSIDSSNKEASGKKKEGEFTFSTQTPSKSNFSFSTSGLISKPSPVTVPKVDEQQTKQAESISFTSFQEPGKRKDVFSIENSGFTISTSKMEPPRVEEQVTPLQKSPLMSLGNIVASIGDDKTTNKNSEKTSGIFGKVSGSVKSPETFKFSLGGSFGGLLSSPSVQTVISADTGKESPPKSSSSSAGVNLKTPLLSFGGNVTQDLPPATSIFGGSGDKSQKPVTSVTGSIFGSGSSFNFGNLMKSPSSTNLFGAVTSTSDAVSASSKQSLETNSDEESFTHTPLKEDNSAASKENQSPTAAVVTSPEITLNQPFFNNLSFGRSSDNIAPSNLFGEGISTPSTTFTFSKSASSPSSPQQQKQEEENDNKENTSSTPILGSLLASNSTTAKETKVSPADASQSTFSFASLATTLIPSTSESQPSSTGVETKPAPVSIFGGSLPATTSAQASSTSFSFALPPASTTSAFGLKSPNMFALTSTPSTVTTTSSTSSFFSQPIHSPPTFGQSGGSIFGQATTGSSLFGQTATTTNTSVFGQTTTTSSSIFGQLSITSPPLFGQTGTTPSVFGQTPSTTISSVFGQTQTTTASVFGQTPSTTSASPFGQTASTTSSSIFGIKQSSNSSIFGQNQTSSGSAAFGNTSSAFGQTSSTESSVFGQSPTNTTSFFGAGAGAFGAKSMFEQSGGSIFGQNTSKPAFGSSGGSLFGGGSSSLFGSSGAAVTPSGNLFQSSGGSSLFGGSTAGGSPGGSGAFSSGVGGSIIQTGFGAGSFSQSKPGGFGSPPAFGQSGGSSPGFGAPATFGGSPTFGGAPTFGSPAKIFGNASSAGGFGSSPSPQQSTAFENLATQNTMTFGNLAQTQGQNPGFVPPNQNVFGTAPASQPAFQSQGSSSFGGNSFSSWR